MNKANQEKAKHIFTELRPLGNAIGELLREESRICESMPARQAVPYARICLALYDARDYVAGAMGYMKYVIGDLQEKENETTPRARRASVQRKG